MVAGILAPEAVAYVACDQMFVVIQAKKRVNYWARLSSVLNSKLTLSQYKLICPHTRAPWTSKMYLFLLMGGFAVETHPGQRIRPTPHKMISLFEEGAIEFPDLEDSDIDTRTKADWFTKTIAIIQIGWFVAQLVGRAIQQLPTTTLELFTSSIVFCGTCTYAFWWKKPFDVQKPFVLYPAQQRQDSTRMWPKDAKRVSCWEAGLNEIEVVPAAFIGAIIVVGFAALHIVGWNFQFPSHVEKVLWRTMSLGCVVIPFIMLVGTRNLPWKYFLYPLAALYLLVRVYLFIEIFMGLRAVPAGVYKTPQWSQYFPALG
jgi:hypothetical protein